jgi:hypothetical protein
MDMGYRNGNRITIPNPTGNPWATEVDLYLYLKTNPEARAALFTRADNARVRTIDSIFVDHPLLWIPFFFDHTTTDETFDCALVQRLANPSSRLNGRL